MEGDARTPGEPPFVELVASLPWASIGATVASIRLVQERKDSAIAAASIVGAGGVTRSVIVKRHRAASRDGRAAPELARHEFAMLSSLQPALQSEGIVGGVSYGTPRPLLLDAERGIVAMERANGEPLDRIIRAARRHASVRALGEPLRRAATWLSLMQRHTLRRSDGGERLDRTIATTLGAFDRATAAGANAGASRDRVERRLRQLARKVLPRSLQVVGSHGDYWPGNVYIDRQRVEVIDFEGFRDGLPLQDVVYLLWYLEQLPLARFDYQRLRSMFLGPYLGGTDLDDAAFTLFRLVRAIESIAWSETAHRSRLRRLLQRSPRSVVAEIVNA